jgi:hypothetical protein
MLWRGMGIEGRELGPTRLRRDCQTNICDSTCSIPRQDMTNVP